MGSIGTATDTNLREATPAESKSNTDHLRAEVIHVVFTSTRRWARCTRCSQDTPQTQVNDVECPTNCSEWCCDECLQLVRVLKSVG